MASGQRGPPDNARLALPVPVPAGRRPRHRRQGRTGGSDHPPAWGRAIKDPAPFAGMQHPATGFWRHVQKAACLMVPAWNGSASLKAHSGYQHVITSYSIHYTKLYDYAHTPDALKNVIETINQIRQPGQELISVVGAGGDRDKTKRPEMAKVAVEGCSRVILTSDNPRSESPQAIIDDMMEGVEFKSRIKVVSIVDRREAIV